MKTALVIGMNKTGTTIVASVIHKSIPGSLLGMEPKLVAHLEQHGTMTQPVVVKILYEHWMQRPYLLTGIVHGETGFRPDKTVAMIRQPRDGLISALMYSVYSYVLKGATREQVDEWVGVLRAKEADPEKYSLLSLMESRSRIFNIGSGRDGFFETFVRYAEWITEEREYFHILSYEDFVAGNTDELTAYLGIELSSSRDVDPGTQRVTRSRQAGNWRTMMLPEDVAYLGGALRRHPCRLRIRRLGHSPRKHRPGHRLRVRPADHRRGLQDRPGNACGAEDETGNACEARLHVMERGQEVM